MLTSQSATRVRRARAAALMTASALALGELSCAAGSVLPLASEHSDVEDAETEPIRRGDLLVVRVIRHPKLSAKRVLVDRRGMVLIPKLGKIQAEGLTTLELKSLIQQRFRKFRAHRHAIVFVSRVADGR